MLLFSILAGLLSGSCTTEKKSSGRPESTAGDSLTIQNAWVRSASRGMTGGGYLTIYNGTSRADTLTGVTTDVAASVEIHESYRQENGISGMRPAGKLPIKAGSRLELKPGGFHLMLMRLNRDLSAGDSISLTLYFAGSDSLEVRIPVFRN